MNYVIIILLSICILLLIINYFKTCSEKTIIYKLRPELDLQFDESNYPSKIYNNMFNDVNLNYGGYKINDNLQKIEYKN